MLLAKLVVMCNHDGDVAFAKIGYVGFGEGWGGDWEKVSSVSS